jgi:hypothetical protein
MYDLAKKLENPYPFESEDGPTPYEVEKVRIRALTAARIRAAAHDISWGKPGERR